MGRDKLKLISTPPSGDLQMEFACEKRSACRSSYLLTWTGGGRGVRWLLSKSFRATRSSVWRIIPHGGRGDGDRDLFSGMWDNELKGRVS